jgi:hypothetical protein
VDDTGAVVVEASSRTVQIPYTQAASPAKVRIGGKGGGRRWVLGLGIVWKEQAVEEDAFKGARDQKIEEHWWKSSAYRCFTPGALAAGVDLMSC